MLQLEGFKKSYSSKLILDIPEYTFGRGIHWVKGQNGSGKTTLFKSLAGILPFDGGITFDNLNLKKEPLAYRTVVNYGEAEPAFPRMVKGSDIVHIFEKYKKAPKNQHVEIAEQLGINFLNEVFGTYSSGMGKKLSLLLAFLGEPRLILLDEPLITLDVASVKSMLDLINHYKTKNGTSFLISSHQAFESGSILPDAVHQVNQGTLYADQV